MNSRFKVETALTDSEAAQIAISNRLFVNGWCLRGDLKEIIADSAHGHCLVARDTLTGKWVGVCFQSKHHTWDTGVFVRAAYRNMKIATILTLEMSKKTGTKFKVYQSDSDIMKYIKDARKHLQYAINREFIG